MNENGYLVYVLQEHTPKVQVFRPATVQEIVDAMLPDRTDDLFFHAIETRGRKPQLRSALTPDLVYAADAKPLPGFYYLEWVE